MSAYLPTTDPMDYAGKYLSVSEQYTIFERALLPFEAVYNIIVPPDAEEFADVSFWQEGTDWDEYRKHARAAIIRIGQGAWKDKEFERNYSEGKRVGCLIGGYWFYDGRYSPQEQAKIIIDAMQGKTFELELYMDWERSYSGAHEGIKNVVALMQLLDAAGLNVKDQGFYTGYYWFIENTNAIKDANQYHYLKGVPLWIAWYAAASLVKVPAPWTDYTLWQCGVFVLSWGQKSKEIDINKSRYSKLEFEKVYINGGTTTPTEPPTGGTMFYVKVTASAGLNMREGAGTSYKKVGALPYGSEVEYDVKQSGWLHIIRARNEGSPALLSNGNPVDGSDSWVSDSYVTAIPQPAWATTTPPPDPDPDPDPDPPPATGKKVTVVVDLEGYKPKTFTDTLEPDDA